MAGATFWKGQAVCIGLVVQRLDVAGVGRVEKQRSPLLSGVEHVPKSTSPSSGLRDKPTLRHTQVFPVLKYNLLGVDAKTWY